MSTINARRYSKKYLQNAIFIKRGLGPRDYHSRATRECLPICVVESQEAVALLDGRLLLNCTIGSVRPAAAGAGELRSPERPAFIHFISTLYFCLFALPAA